MTILLPNWGDNKRREQIIKNLSATSMFGGKTAVLFGPGSKQGDGFVLTQSLA